MAACGGTLRRTKVCSCATDPGALTILIRRMPETKPPLVVELAWTDTLRFNASSGQHSMVIDGDGHAGPSPMQALAFGVAGCMAADVVAILQKGRHPVTALRVVAAADR